MAQKNGEEMSSIVMTSQHRKATRTRDGKSLVSLEELAIQSIANQLEGDYSRLNNKTTSRGRRRRSKRKLCLPQDYDGISRHDKLQHGHESSKKILYLIEDLLSDLATSTVNLRPAKRSSSEMSIKTVFLTILLAIQFLNVTVFASDLNFDEEDSQQVSPSNGRHLLAEPLPLQLGKVRTVNPGDRVNIPCSLANLGGSIQFAKDEQPIVLDSGCAHCQLDISNDGQASLTINRVGQRDQGHWQCWRLDRDGTVKQKVPIVELRVSNSPELPVLVVNDKELLGGNNLDATVSVRENELVTFKCLIRGASTPVDYVYWMLDSSQNVTQSSQLMIEYSSQEQNYLTQSVLKLNATKAMNLKSVSCLSNHQLWLTPMTVSAFLNVLYEPSFTISREPGFGVPVSEGMSVVLKCEIDSNPSSLPVWIRDADTNKTSDQQVSSSSNQRTTTTTGGEPIGEPTILETRDDGSVLFAPARRSDSGWYRCKTENKQGNFSSFGYYLNVRPAGTTSVNQATQQARPRQEGISSSRLLGPNQPAAQVAAPQHFQHVQQQAMARHQHHQQQQQQQQVSSSSHNMINNDQPAAVLESGQQSSLTPANNRCPQAGGKIQGAPEIESPVISVQALLGRQLILPLRFCCEPGPARVFWIHRHLAMVPGRMFGPYITRDVYTTYNSLHCYESTFEIEALKPEDIGTVYAFVSNEKGHAGAQIHIQLAKQEQQQQQQQVIQHSQIGTRFHLLAPSSSSSSVLREDWLISALSLLVSLLIRHRIET